MYKSVIIGCGAISSKHADGILKSNHSLVGCCDKNKTALSLFCEKYGCKGYTDYKEMLEKEQPDAVHICLPHFLHFEAAEYALSRNIAVFLEKPPVLNERELEALKKYSDKKLTVCFQNRFNATTSRAKQIIQSNQYGKLLGANAACTWERYGKYYAESDWRGKKRTEGGSALINQAIHTLDLLCFLMGKPTSVKAVLSNMEHPCNDTEDAVFSLVDFNDKRATFLATTCAASSPPATITLIFEKARVQFDTKTLSVYTKTDAEIKLTANSTEVGKECWGDSHINLIEKFYEFLDGGQNPCSIVDCEDTLKLMFEIYKGELR